MEAYLDNSATTRCSERAKNKMVQILTEDYGNPSSLHNMGKTAEDYIKEAKEQIAKTLRCDEKEIIFTSGGTESNNMALIGGALANKRQGKHIITTAIEHASVQAPLAYLKELGYEITELSVDHDGIISLEELRDAVREDTVRLNRSRKRRRSSRRRIRTRCFMWMRFRRTANSASARKRWGLIYSR